MTLLRNLAKSGLKPATLRAELAKRPSFNLDRIKNWTQILNSKATSSESRNSCIQLSSLVGYYTKPSKSGAANIDWKEWQDSIVTEGIVDTLKGKYDKIMAEEYDVEKIVDQVIVSHSPEVDYIDKALTYHGSLWLHKYSQYQEFFFQLGKFGNPLDYSIDEVYDFFYGLEADLEELTETHNYFPGSKDDINVRGYLVSQFAWGKKVVSFYRHPCDDFKCARGTKNILGR